MKKFNEITLELLMHKYRYYELNYSSISDYEYDMLEHRWTKLGNNLGIDMENYQNWVDFPTEHPLADYAKRMVNGEKIDNLDEILDTSVPF